MPSRDDDDEETPLLWSAAALDDPHKQFCRLIGVPPSNGKDKYPYIGPKTLYGRATRQYASARRGHNFMSSLNNILLLSQVILGATLTALGASESSHILITLFGVMNTVIAGLVAYLKSRGQPARTRLFRDDLSRVVDEIENSEIMWLGIAQGIHGYDDIDIDDKVTVRSEVARLMRLYEKAMRSWMMSNPDNYLMGQSDGAGTALRSRAGIGGGFPPNAPTTMPVLPTTTPLPVAAPGPSTTAPVAQPSVEPPAARNDEDPDQSPATAPRPPSPESEVGKGKDTASDSKDPPAPSKDATPPPAHTDNDSKDKPPSYKDSPAASKDDLKPVPTTEPSLPAASTPAASTPAATPAPSAAAPPPTTPSAPEGDPDESPATAARGYERSRSSSGDKKKGKE